MNCPRCGQIARIDSSRWEVTGDDSPETPTRLYLVQTLRCRNPRCDRSGEKVAELRRPLEPGELRASEASPERGKEGP